jgi:integrase
MSQIVKPFEATGPTPIRPLAVVPDDTDWDAFAGQWERSLRARNVAPLTLRRYLQSYRRLAGWAVAAGIGAPDEITGDQLEEFFSHELSRTTRTGRQAKPGSVAIDYRHLRVFFNWLADKDDVASPMAKLHAPSVPETPVPLFTDEALKALIAACKGRDFTSRRDTAIVRLLLDAGLRRAEIANLTVFDLDLREQTATVLGKRSKTRTVAYGTKTAEAIDDYLRMRRRHPDRNRDQLWLAASPHRGALGYDGLRLMLDRRAKAAGVEGMFAHRFRHTAVSAFLEAGGSEGDAMTIFGWASRDMLQRYGAAAKERRAIAAARRLNVGDRI